MSVTSCWVMTICFTYTSKCYFSGCVSRAAWSCSPVCWPHVCPILSGRSTWPIRFTKKVFPTCYKNISQLFKNISQLFTKYFPIFYKNFSKLLTKNIFPTFYKNNSQRFLNFVAVPFPQRLSNQGGEIKVYLNWQSFRLAIRFNAVGSIDYSSIVY